MLNYESMLITPAIAAEMLKHNTSNRPLSPAYVKSYAEAMKRGEWKDNGEDIIFFSDGTLGNGAHRLNAIIQSGCSVRMGVKKGVTPDSFTTYDNGRNRNAGQLLAMMDVKQGNTVAAIVKFLYVFRKGSLGCLQSKKNDNVVTVNFNPKEKLTNSQVISLFEAERDIILNSIKQTQFCAEVRRHPISRSQVSALYIYLQQDLGYAFEDVDKFFRELISYKSSSNPYIEPLRVAYLRNGDGGYKMDARKIRNLLNSTWNDCMSKKPLSKRKKDGAEFYRPFWREDTGEVKLMHRDEFEGRQLLLAFE